MASAGVVSRGAGGDTAGEAEVEDASVAGADAEASPTRFATTRANTCREANQTFMTGMYD
jgi:hypothetical protein